MTPYTREAAEDDLTAALAAGQTAAALRAAHHLDGLPQSPPASLLGAALWYADQGLPVFPIQPGGKKPWRGTRGLKDATTDPDTIRDWWTSGPAFAESNVALATGHLVDVIDYDGQQAHTDWGSQLGYDGHRWHVAICPNCGRSWDTRWYGNTCTCGTTGDTPPELDNPETTVIGAVSTPRPGGLHHYVPATGAGNRAGFVGQHVDYRGLGGYVLLPPSRLDDRPGQHPGTYRWLRPLTLEGVA